MRAHVIKNGKVVNTIVVDSLNAIPGLELIEATEGEIGWSYDGQNILPPTPEEIAEQEREEALAKLQATDAEMARVVEDIYDALSETAKAKVPQSAKDKIAQRKMLREQLRGEG